MNIGKMSVQRRKLALNLLLRYGSLIKIAKPGEFVVTDADEKVVDPDLVPIIELLQSEESSQAAFTEEQLKRLTIIVDFMAVALPDLEEHAWQPEVIDLASYLRKCYHKCYGGSVYGNL